MAVEYSKGSDSDYLDWINRNRSGWVANADKNPKSSYLQMHKAWCETISGNQAPGAFTERDYSKFCSPSKVELEEHLKERLGVKPAWNCPACG